MALPETTAARLANVATPQSKAFVSPSTTITSSTLTPSWSATIWANTVSCPCPCEVRPGIDVDLAGDRVDLDVAALVGAEAGALDVAGEAEAEILALAARLLLLGGEALRAEPIGHHLQRLVILPAVQADLQAVGEEEALPVIGELRLGDEVAATHLEAVEPELLGELVHRALDGEAGLRPAAAAVGRHRNGRRVDGGELDPDVRDAVGPGDRRRGDLGDGDAVGDEGAGVVQEAVAQRDHLAGLPGVQLDEVDLRPLLRGADEILAPVLDVFDRPAELHRRHRHEQLVGIEEEHLLAEAAADIGGDDANLVLVELEDRSDAAAHRDRRLRSVPDGQFAG